MATADTSGPAASSGSLVCPDPSAHESLHHQRRLQDQAAGAALYATSSQSPSDRASNARESINPQGPDGKLSSAGAAASLKHARAQDLPSFPSVGIDKENSGLAAASLAHANPQDVRYPEVKMSNDHALKAAVLAKDHKMKPLWQPEASDAGAKAALLAHHGKGRDWWQPSPSKEGNSAAKLAMGKGNLGPELDYGYTEDGRSKALKAARLSVKGSRRRSDSTPNQGTSQTDNDAARWSLQAAKGAHNDGLESRANEASRITHARNLSKELYTSHPDVSEFDKKEKAHQDALKGATLSMAKKMYAMQTVDSDGNIALNAANAGTAARTAGDRSSSGASPDLKTQAMQYLTLQDAAQRLAAERLAKIEDQNEAAAFRDYYGYSGKKRNRLSVIGRNRRRASSEGPPMRAGRPSTEASQEPGSPKPHRRNLDVDSDDEEQAQRIRNQMYGFNAKLAEADKKRETDRKTLMAAAERKVQAQMNQMDKKVYNDTGKMSQAMMDDWDNRARAKAAAASQARMANHGRVDIGGGKFLDQEEIDAIAARSVQPTLTQITETAEKQRARDEEIRLEKAEARRQQQLEKERNAEHKAISKQSKAEEKEAEKQKKREDKLAAQLEKNAQKDERKREKELAKDESQRDKETAGEQRTAMAMRQEEPDSPKEKKSPWKKILPGHRKRESRDVGEERTEKDEGPTSSSGKPNKLNKGKSPATDDEEPEPGRLPSEPSTIAAINAAAESDDDMGKSKEKDEVELTPTGATMASSEPAQKDHERDDAPAVAEPSAAAANFVPAPVRKTTADEPQQQQEATPSSPSKKRFSRILGKLKGKKDKSSGGERQPGTFGSFSGGAKLNKERESDRSRSNLSVADPQPSTSSTGAADTTTRTADRESEVSSLSSDDYSDDAVANAGRSDMNDSRGRTTKRAGSELTPSVSRDSDGDDFEEARDQFDEELVPPPKKELLSKKTESPVRDSKFHEAL